MTFYVTRLLTFVVASFVSVKGTADKIYEFLSTGKMEKLEEKRAAAGA